MIASAGPWGYSTVFSCIIFRISGTVKNPLNNHMKNHKYLYIVLAGLIVSQSSFTALASFSDVQSGNTYADAINYAEQQGIVGGYPDGTFKPANNINRAEFTKIIIGAALDYNSAQDPSGYDIYALAGVHFSDVQAGQWYIPYLRKALENQVIGGYPDGTFKPANKINFAEAAKIIVGAYKYDITADPTTWYKPYVEKLAEMKAIPASVTGFDYRINRGEMVEIIYRLQQKITNKDSKTYAQLAGTSGGTTTPPVSPPATTNTNPPKIGSCQIYPSDNAWNRDVSADPVDPNSANYIASIGASGHLHADFGGNGEYGIPINIVGAGQALVPINITDYPEESDPGPYPVPADARVENGGDAHLLTLDTAGCILYELYVAAKNGSGWDAAQASKFDLKSNALRPEGWTSADAAGLPILPGLARYDEVAGGAVNHALRFTVSESQKAYIHPATHYASSNTDSNRPPMGLRLRLKANYDLSGFTGESLVILQGLKKYGMIVADNGSNWYITGEADTRWNDDDLNQLKTVPGSAFEVVQSGTLIK